MCFWRIMSRSAKSRSEKSRTRGSVQTPVSAPPPPSLQQTELSSDIIPGCLTENSWREMLEQEEGEELVAELITELMDQVLDRCYQVHLQRQLVPFCVRWARGVFVETLEWRFLMKDEGEDADSAPLWTEDPEPEPSITDSWAEGCVPIIYTNQQTHTPLLQKLLDINLEESEDKSNSNTPAHPESEHLHLPDESDLKSVKTALKYDKTPTPPAFQNKSKASQRKQQALLKPLTSSLPDPLRKHHKPAHLIPVNINEDQNIRTVKSRKTLPLRPVRPQKQVHTEMGKHV